MQNRYELWDTEPRNEYQRCPYTGITTYYEPRSDEWVAETPHGSRRYGRSQGEAFSEALDAFRIERDHALKSHQDEEIPFDGSTPQWVIDRENEREAEAQMDGRLEIA